MFDGPSLGGFVCPATIASAQLWKMGQVSAKDTVLFKPLTLGGCPAATHTPCCMPQHAVHHVAMYEYEDDRISLEDSAHILQCRSSSPQANSKAGALCALDAPCILCDGGPRLIEAISSGCCAQRRRTVKQR
jgi:hypothetical protein